MNRISLSILVLSALLAALAAGCASPAQTAAPTIARSQPTLVPTPVSPTAAPGSALEVTVTPHIIGRVTQALEPVPGARVEIRQGDKAVAQAVASADGAYNLIIPPSGDYTLVVVWPDGQAQAGAPLHLPQPVPPEFVVNLDKNIQVVEPAINAELNASPLLRWTQTPGASRYHVVVVDAGTTELAMQPAESTGTSLQVTPEIKTGRTYDWSVDALDSSGKRVAALTGRFTLKGSQVSAPPTAPVPAYLEGVPPECLVRGRQTKSYVMRQDDYCFIYPARFEQGNLSNRQPNILGPALDKSLDPLRANLTIEVKPANGKGLDSLVDEALKEFAGMSGIQPIKRTSITLAQGPAIVAEPIPGRLSSRVVFTVHGDKLYRLAFWPVGMPQAQADMDELYNMVTSSFGHLIK